MNRKLLILDDEPAVLEAYQGIFAPAVSSQPLRSSRRSSAVAAIAPSPESFEIQCVKTGEEALKILEQAKQSGSPFVGGFFDVKLGNGMDGIETIRRAKEMDPGLLCVVVTAYQDRSIDEISRLFGEEYADRWDFLTKPFSHNEILQKARNLISQWDRREREKKYLEQIKTQQEQLIRTERLAAIGALARGIGHEFGNILHRLIGMAEIAIQKKDPTESISTLQNIAKGAERAGVIVRNLQSLVKMETKRESLSLVEPVGDALQLVEHELKKYSIDYKTEWATDLPAVRASSVELSQVALNIIINAIHAMEQKGGTLTLRTYREKEWAVLEISDTGCVIPPENIPKLFEPLFTTKGERGTGIGLSVCKKIITNHNGTISVDSTVGKGTTFRVFLPVSK
jgi:signal transduction histidine kinase